MPLPYATIKPLNIPVGRFDADGILALVLHGECAGDVWTFRLHPSDGVPAAALKTVYGTLTASVPEASSRARSEVRDSSNFHSLALESALFWLITETRRHQWRLGHVSDQTEIIAEQDRPKLIIVEVVLVDGRFKPMPGAVLLDERITGQQPD